MPIEMISPRTVFNRRPLGRYIIDYECESDNELPLLNPNNEFWLVRTISNIQNELYISGRYAVLHNFTALGNSHIFTGFADKQIICATFTCFAHKMTNNSTLKSIFDDEEKSIPTGVMLFTEDVGKYYGFNAEIVSCKLPCRIEQVWSVRNCILAERAQIDGDVNTSMFAMTNCLEEITPVVYVDDMGHNGFVNDTRVRIITLCARSLLLLVYNEREESFSLWRIRDAVKDDFQNLYSTNTDGSVTAVSNKTHARDVSDRDSNCVSMTSTEGFNHKSRSLVEVAEKTIDDLDIRSPLARSLKNINDVNTSGKELPFHHGVKNHVRIKGPKERLNQEPLYPKICLQQMYTFKPQNAHLIFNPTQTMSHSTPMNGGKHKQKKNGSHQETCLKPKGFFAEDFYDRKFLCYLVNVNEHRFMHMITFNYEGFHFSHGKEERFRILDAVYLPKLKVIVMLEENKTLSLYTGTNFVCKISLLNSLIREPDMFSSEQGKELSTESISSLSRLSEATNCGFTMYTNTDLALRLYLPEMVRFHLVKKCLHTLKKLLPIDIGMTLLCRWYSLNRAVDDNQSAAVEWPRFVDFLLENIGFRRSQQQNDRSLVGNVRDLSLEGSDMSMEEDICIKKVRTTFSIDNWSKSHDHLNAYTNLSINLSDQLLVSVARTVLYSLHLVYEAEKMNYSMSVYLGSLGALNCAIACAVGSTRYVEYYVTDQPDLWATGVNRLPSIKEYLCDGDSGVWEVCPPDWSFWFCGVMMGDGSCPQRTYPVIDGLNEGVISIMALWLVMFRHHRLVDCGPEVAVNEYLHRFRYISNGTVAKCPLTSTDTVLKTLLASTVATTTLHNTVFERAACHLSELDYGLTDLDYVNPGLASSIRVACFQSRDAPPHLLTTTGQSSQGALYRLLERTDLEKQRDLILPIINDCRQPHITSAPWKSFRRLSNVRQSCVSYWSHSVRLPGGFPSPATASITTTSATTAPTAIATATTRRNRALDNCYLLSLLQDDPVVRMAYPDVRVGEAYKMLQSCSPVELDVSVCSHFTMEEGDSPSEALKEELEGHVKTITFQRTFALPFGRGMLGLQVLNSCSLVDTLHVPPLCMTGKYLLSDSGKPHTVDNNTSQKSWPNFHNGVAAGLMISPMNHLVDYVWILKQCPSNQLEKIDLTPEKAGVMFGLGLNGHLNKLSQVTIGDIIKSMNEMATMAVLIGLSAHNLGSRNLSLSKHISFHYRCLIPEERDHNEQIPSLCQVAAIISAGLLNFKSGDRKMARIFLEEMGRSREHLTADGSSPVDIELTSVTAGFSVGLIMFQQGSVLSREHNPEELVRLTNYLKGGYRLPSKENVPTEAPSDSHIRLLLKNHLDSRKPQPISQPTDSWTSFQATNPRVLEGEYYNTDITGAGAAAALGMIFMASSDEVVARQLRCPETFTLLEEIRAPLVCFRQIAWGMVMWREVLPSRAWVEASVPRIVADNCLQKRPTAIPEKYWDTVNESYFQLLVGSCFVLGMRYAGTDNDEARETIISYVVRLLEVKKDAELMQTLNKAQYEWALSVVFLSACMVAAGTGNLRLLKMVRVLRSVHHPKEFANYGVNTAYSMAIGLLFLGGGKLTLSNSPRCAAILLISFFPRFPPIYSGRRYHLQALRHLYVIATRPRVMCAVDIDTHTTVPISSRITLKVGVRSYEGCFVYPPEDPATIEEVEFFHPEGKYYPQTYRPDTEQWNILLQSFMSGGFFFVKRRVSGESVRTIMDTFAPETMTRGFELRDHQLMVDFLDVTGCSEIDSLNQQRIEFHLLRNKDGGIKEAVAMVTRIDLDNLCEVGLLYDWCNQRGLLGMLSLFLVYMKVSLRGLKAFLSGEDNSPDMLSEEGRFLMHTILQ